MRERRQLFLFNDDFVNCLLVSLILKVKISQKSHIKKKKRKSCVGGSAQPGRFERKALTMFTAPTITWYKFSGRGLFSSSNIYNHIFCRADDFMSKFLIHIEI